MNFDVRDTTYVCKAFAAVKAHSLEAAIAQHLEDLGVLLALLLERQLSALIIVLLGSSSAVLAALLHEELALSVPERLHLAISAPSNRAKILNVRKPARRGRGSAGARCRGRGAVEFVPFPCSWASRRSVPDDEKVTWGFLALVLGYAQSTIDRVFRGGIELR